MENIYIMNVKINNITFEQAIENLKNQLINGNRYIIYTPNTEIIMMCQKDDEFQKYINDGDMVVPDGVGLIYASKIKKIPLSERITGFDLSVKLLELADENKLKLYIIGGEPGVAKKAVQNIGKDYPNIDICGYNHGYFKGTHIGLEGHDEENKIIEDINNKSPDILFVCLGAKKQEKWIHQNKQKINAKILIGNGGTVDVLAGNVKRSPDIFINLGLEWLYRLIREPKRIRRQMSLPIFALKIIFGKKDIVRK